ncbi:Cys-tRNA(Pro) deacylase, prolyl-tRNA editing enzyme YbaK/EbsC [Streptoalloteichus tenebrarius]|uniref:Cys-tRNA(Pro) deacylase, prolyl-tRNA editing enzyme YbaK/EbsC n=1 Tax=Streptoalloteichus tenebrarius (strain ATCC 17920 / DSM 40477 / JCM 4838 / CBS 697.72 / NBRC 16177 / NCIMB 11028 / NRRL B-12390 / A12253. 1 / ISP 5477) TaxID=1933 RepID=A0ABT1HML5_STRSD|nr:YbaK/EbsC family protein [Streptoalloteichus tenebrarius]MCP2256745.1 Cys-tRNA(Pro) deacylase, prolyl-tRNA editing enzyme YbaK/EbsC [Streptoalloteichus tenebrarius]BFF00352.1 YbaK/EbsC family protein [Streptoalloteichus tenebrarius]
MSSLAHPGIQKVTTALREAGAAEAALGVRVLDQDARTAAQAAAALGVPVGAIANSLVFDADGEPLLVLTSGAHRADTRLLAELVGVARVRRADPEFVRAATGQTIGGVAPVGHPAPLRTVIDEALAVHPVVWAAAGHPRAVFPTTCARLAALTGAPVARVARDEVGSAAR